MPEPIVFVSNQRIKAGKLEAYKELYREVVRGVEANNPGTVAHLGYVSEDGSEATIIHVFPDAKAMEAHVLGVDEAARKALELAEIVGFVIYGKPTDKIIAMMQKAAGGGIALSIRPEPIGGYIRFKAD